MELSWKLWRISKSWIILFWWLDRESLLCKLLLLCFPGWQQMTHMILCKMDVFFGCSYKNLLNWLFFSQPNHNKICWEQTHVKMYLGEVLHMRNMSNLSKAKKWTLWLRNEYLTSGSTEIMAWKWFSNIERSWCLHPFHRHYFSGHKFFYSSAFSAVCTINFLESISSIKTYRSWYNLYVFGSFHFIECLRLSLSSVLIMFVNKMIFLIMSSTRMFWFTWPATLLGLDFQHIFGFFHFLKL